jgi:hypothetical protein
MPSKKQDTRLLAAFYNMICHFVAFVMPITNDRVTDRQNGRHNYEIKRNRPTEWVSFSVQLQRLY